MVTWHLLTAECFPRWFSFPIIQSVNFVAEGFVFLAGVAASIVSSKPGFRYSRFAQRAVQILFAHYSILACLLILNQFEMINIREANGETLSEVTYSILTLKYQPYLADVLTVFVFLFLMAPGFIIFQSKCGRTSLLTMSFFLFILWQPWAIGNTFQLNSHGAFDANTWQFVFCLGIVAGGVRIRFAQYNNLMLWRMFIFFLIVTLTLGALRFLSLSQKLSLFSAELYGRHPLTLMRLLFIASQFLLMASATYLTWPKINQSRIAREVVRFGQHSLLVFCVSVPLDYLAKAILEWLDAGLILGTLVLCLVISLLWLTAHIAEYRKKASGLPLKN